MKRVGLISGREYEIDRKELDIKLKMEFVRRTPTTVIIADDNHLGVY